MSADVNDYSLYLGWEKYRSDDTRYYRSVCMSVVYDYQVTDMNGRGV